MFPYISGILAAILPNLSYEAEDITRKDVTQQEHKRIGVMSKKLYIDLMRIFSEQAPTLRETGGDVKHLQNILEVLDGQLQAGKNKSIKGVLLESFYCKKSPNQEIGLRKFSEYQTSEGSE